MAVGVLHDELEVASRTEERNADEVGGGQELSSPFSTRQISNLLFLSREEAIFIGWKRKRACIVRVKEW
jgi:hypothetical protein